MGANKRCGSSKTQVGQSSPNTQSAKSSAGKKARAKPKRKRKDVISLGQETLAVRRGVGKRERITADDLIVERLVHRALSEEKLGDIKELYKRCDTEIKDAWLVQTSEDSNAVNGNCEQRNPLNLEDQKQFNGNNRASDKEGRGGAGKHRSLV